MSDDRIEYTPDSIRIINPIPPQPLPTRDLRDYEAPAAPTPEQTLADYIDTATEADSKTMDSVLKVAGSLIGPIVSVISPEIRQILVDTVLELQVKAQGTENPADDALVGALKVLLGIKENPSG